MEALQKTLFVLVGLALIPAMMSCRREPNATAEPDSQDSAMQKDTFNTAFMGKRKKDEPQVPSDEEMARATRPKLEKNEMQIVVDKARNANVRYVVFFSSIKLLSEDGIKKAFVQNEAARKIYGGSQYARGNEPEGYISLVPGVALYPELDKKAKAAGFKNGYQEDVFYIFWKGLQKPFIIDTTESDPLRTQVLWFPPEFYIK